MLVQRIIPAQPFWASLGALRGGAGIIKLFYPPAAAMQMARAPYEVIHIGWAEREWNEALAKAKAVFIGPGLGRSDEIKKWLENSCPKSLCPSYSMPML